MTWEEVIQDDVPPDAVDTQPDIVNPCVIDSLVFEESLHSVRLFGQWGHAAHHVAIPYATLDNVVRVDVIDDAHLFVFENVFYSLPVFVALTVVRVHF